MVIYMQNKCYLNFIKSSLVIKMRLKDKRLLCVLYSGKRVSLAIFTNYFVIDDAVSGFS